MKVLTRLNRIHAYIVEEERIRDLLDTCKDIKSYEINKDGTVSIVTEKFGGKIPDTFVDNSGRLLIQFDSCDGDFECSKKMTTLEGCPSTVSGSFDCSDTKISDLSGCPKYVGDGFYASRLKIKSLEKAPSAKRYYLFDDKSLTSLRGLSDCEQISCEGSGLMTLEGCPSVEWLGCTKTNISSLEGCPDQLEYLNVDGCKNLTSFKGGPSVITVALDCKRCPNLTSVEGFPTTVAKVNAKGSPVEPLIKGLKSGKKTTKQGDIIEEVLIEDDEYLGDLYLTQTPSGFVCLWSSDEDDATNRPFTEQKSAEKAVEDGAAVLWNDLEDEDEVREFIKEASWGNGKFAKLLKTQLKKLSQ